MKRALFRVFRVAAVVALGSCGAAVAGDGAEHLDARYLESIAPIAADRAVDAPGDNVLLLQFWASWCHSCGSIMWDMDELASRYPGLEYIAVSIDDEAVAARDYLEKHPLYAKHPSRYFHDVDRELSSSLGVKTVPSIFLIDRAGDVLVHKRGHLNGGDLRDLAVALQSVQ